MTEERPALWPELEELLERPGSRARILPVSAGSPTFARLGLARWSALGALASSTGGVLLCDGWIRVFGGVGEGMGARLPALDEVNAPGAEHFVVACDVLGGVFAIDGGAFGRADAKLHYFGPDTLDWLDLEIGVWALIEAMCSGADEQFYEELRWPGWEAEVIMLGLDEGIGVYPFLCTRGTTPVANASRRAVPMDELVDAHVELLRHIEGREPSPVPSLREVERG